MDIISWLAGLIPNPTTLYQKRRYRGRVRLELGWVGAGVYVFDRPNKLWRTVEVIVTASRDEDCVVARGAIEVRAAGAREWKEAWLLTEALTLPVTVSKNMEESYRIDGESLVKHIRPVVQVHSDEALSIRVRVEDYHRVRLMSNPLDVSLSELQRTQLR